MDRHSKTPKNASNSSADSRGPRQIKCEGSSSKNKPTLISRVFESVPTHEIQQLIWDRLDLKSKQNCRLVCKQWEESVNETLDFNPVLSDATAEDVKKSTKPIHQLTIVDLQRFQYPKEGMGLESVKKMRFKDCIHVAGGWKEGKISFDNLNKLLAEAKDLKWLEVSGDVLSRETIWYNILKKVELNCLQRLQINADAEDRSGSRAVVSLLHNTFPTLQSINIEFNGSRKESDNQRVYIDPIHTEIFRFIGKHWQTLKGIRVFREDIVNEDQLEIRLDDMDQGVEIEIIEQLKLVQLETFKYLSTSCDLVCEFANELFKAQKTLREMILCVDGHMGMWDLFPQVCQQCSQTLEKVTIEGSFEEGGSFSCSVFANLSKLEMLSLVMFGTESISDIQYLPKQLKIFFYEDITLRADQVYFIAEEMFNLETLYLTQLGWHGGSAKVDLSMFKKLMGMRRLTKLVLDKRTSDHFNILVWIANHGQGCVKPEVNQYRFYYTVTIDRSCFDSSRI